MIQLTATSRIFLGIALLDFPKGIDGICASISRQFDLDPMNGSVFAFRNRRGTQIKLLFYDGTGFWLCIKRLSKGVFW